MRVAPISCLSLWTKVWAKDMSKGCKGVRECSPTTTSMKGWTPFMRSNEAVAPLFVCVLCLLQVAAPAPAPVAVQTAVPVPVPAPAPAPALPAATVVWCVCVCMYKLYELSVHVFCRRQRQRHSQQQRQRHSQQQRWTQCHLSHRRRERCVCVF